MIELAMELSSIKLNPKQCVFLKFMLMVRRIVRCAEAWMKRIEALPDDSSVQQAPHQLHDFGQSIIKQGRPLLWCNDFHYIISSSFFWLAFFDSYDAWVARKLAKGELVKD